MHIKIRHLSYSLLVGICCIGFYPLTSEAVALQHYELDEYVRQITQEIDNYYTPQNDSMRNAYSALRHLCQTLTQDNFHYWTVEILDGNTPLTHYSMRWSVFASILCNSLTSPDDASNSSSPQYALNSFIKTPTIRALGVACKPTGGNPTSDCALRQRNSNTDYPYIFYNLARYIFNDIVNLGLARIYGVTNTNKSTSDLANALALNTFNTTLAIPQQKNYPQSLKHLENMISIGKNIHKNTRIIDSSLELPSNIPDLCDRYTFLYYDQELFSDTCQHLDEVIMLGQYNGITIDILYNELFFYSLFNQIYISYLDTFRNNADAQALWLQQLPTHEAIKLQQQKALDQEEILNDALQDSLRQLNYTSALYPLHLGLTLYQEWLLQLRNNLANIYLPLHQLHYKLQNVQSAG